MNDRHLNLTDTKTPYRNIRNFGFKLSRYLYRNRKSCRPDTEAEMSCRPDTETEMSCRPDTEAEMSCRPDTEAKMSCRPDTKTDNFRSLN